MLKRLLPGIKNTLLIALAIIMAYVFIWQRIALQNLSCEIGQMESEIRQLEKNRDYLKAEILYDRSLDQIKNRAISELGMVPTNEREIIPYLDSLPALPQSRNQIDSGVNPGPALAQIAVKTHPSGKSHRRAGK